MRCWSLLLFALVSLPLPASAQELESLLGIKLQEVSHDVVATVTDDGRATFDVERTFRNPGSGDDELYVEIELPPLAVASDLKIRHGKRWHRGKLMLSERAESRYDGDKTTSPARLGARPRALLVSIGMSDLGLRAAPVPAGGTLTVSYRLRAPLEYESGHYLLKYPALREASSGLVAPRVRVIAPGRVFAPSGAPARAALPVARSALQACGDKGCLLHSLEVKRTLGKRVAFRAEIEHPRPEELLVEALSPSGHAHTLKSRGKGVWSMKLTLEPGDRDPGPWELRVTDKLAGQVGVLKRWSIRQGKRTLASSGLLRAPLLDAGQELYDGAVWRVAPKDAKTRAALSVVQITPKRAIAHAEVVLAGALSEAPKDPQVVFVLDTSHSNEALDTQRDILLSYLTHMPGASVQVVTFARKARALWPSFLPAAQAAKRLRSHTFAPANGSAIEEGLRAATQALDTRTGTKRVVVVTDASFRPSLTLDRAADAMQTSGVVMHVVQTGRASHDDVIYRRDGDDAWTSRLAAAHAGISATFRVPLSPEDPVVAAAQMRRWSEHLVRPILLEYVTLKGWRGADIPQTMPEGSAWSSLEQLDAQPRKIELRGRLWQTTFVRKIVSTRARIAETAAFAFSHERTYSLSPAQARKLALRARVVTEHTALFAGSAGAMDEYGARGGRGQGGGGTCGCGGSMRMSGGHVMRRPPPKIPALVRATAKACAAKHGALPGPVTLTMERDRHEVLDVSLNVPTSTPTHQCIVEGVWGYALPSSAFKKVRDTIHVSL